ncbi:MAG: LytTR family DNA-binding domain-containing protein [Lachnospiraceae bacterium]|nr:LytTR family DNA-binding domain-containing protein [Lachnospiraceae bacterium]
MIEIAICDDDRKDRQNLNVLIQKYATGAKEEFCIKHFESGEQLIDSDFIPDILFLDIAMNEKDGIQVGMEIKNIKNDILIVYTTNLPYNMAAAMNRVHSFGYLIKPIVEEEVFDMLSGAIKQFKLNYAENRDIISFVSSGNKVISLHAMDVYYFEYVNRQVRAATKEGFIVCKETISEMAKRMEKYGFAMSHQSFVVNLYHVDNMAEQMLIMKNGARVYLAQKRVAGIKNRLILVARKSAGDGGHNGH